MKAKPIKGYRTVAINGIAAVVPVIDYLVNNGAALSPFLGPQGAAILSILGAVNIGLRAVTDTEIFRCGK